MLRAKLTILSLIVVLTAVACAGGGSTQNFSATLTGSEDNVNTSATGDAAFQVSSDGSQITYKLNVSNINNVTQAHIHLAPVGQAGEIVVWLYPSAPPAQEKPGVFSGTLAQGTITAANLTGSLSGKPLSSLIDEMKKGNAYVNVHTTQYPAGEIRGQIK